jgi:type VI secretion system protein ImpA
MAKIRDEASEALEAWEAMATILDERAGADAPSTSQVRDLIREIAEIATRYAPEEEGAAEVDEVEAIGGAADSTSGGPASGRLGGVAERAVTREDALRNLESIAEFFRKTEPQSPLSFTLDEAVRRARMPWLDLLDEVIGDRSTRDSILTALGIRPPPPPEE